VVIKKIILSNYFKKYANYLDAFHGTKFENFQSIAKNGLKRPGDTVDGKKLDVVAGHISLATGLLGHKDWARAVFLSPSIYYAAHPVYSKEVISQHETWLPVVQVKVLKGSFNEY
jgi:hypothetical protein